MGEINLQATSAFRNTPKFSFAGRNETSDKKNGKAPGPGDYAQIPEDRVKYRRQPSSNFGAPEYRSKDRGYEKCPGPGAYSPPFAKSSSTSWSFGTGFGSSAPSRFRRPKTLSVPAPGNYEIRGKLGEDCPNVTVRCKLDPLKPDKKPDPGAYGVPSDKQTATLMPRASFGTSVRQEERIPKTPGPGAYAAEAFGYSSPMRKSAPAFTAPGKPQERPPKHPGPQLYPAGSTFK